MDRARINDVDIAYDVRGDGEPVLLIHGAFVADGLLPLIQQPALEGFRVIRYHRRGYGDSTGDATPDLLAHVADARALLEYVGAVPAHIIGHSYGGSMALQLAAASPEMVRSIVALEPGLPAHIPSAEIVGEAIQKIIAPANEGDLETAAHQFLRSVMGRDYRQFLEYNVGPNTLAQAFADADDGLAGDLASFEGWTFTADDAARIKCPTLVIQGGMSDDIAREAFTEFGVDASGVEVFGEMTEILRSWLPHADVVTLGELGHALQIQDAWAVGVALAPFMAKNRSVVPA